jgi:hypothetical protein
MVILMTSLILVILMTSLIQVSHSEVFKEVTLELRVTSELAKYYSEYLGTHSQWLPYEPKINYDGV